MISQKYIRQAKKIVRKYFPKNIAFIFGSSLREEKFYDVDIALLGDIQQKDALGLKEAFLESDFPRPVDIVLFEKTENSFQSYVLEHERKEWI